MRHGTTAFELDLAIIHSTGGTSGDAIFGDRGITPISGCTAPGQWLSGWWKMAERYYSTEIA